jgi:hypothetical protein
MQEIVKIQNENQYIDTRKSSQTISLFFKRKKKDIILKY